MSSFGTPMGLRKITDLPTKGDLNFAYWLARSNAFGNYEEGFDGLVKPVQGIAVPVVCPPVYREGGGVITNLKSSLLEFATGRREDKLGEIARAATQVRGRVQAQIHARPQGPRGTAPPGNLLLGDIFTEFFETLSKEEKAPFHH